MAVKKAPEELENQTIAAALKLVILLDTEG